MRNGFFLHKMCNTHQSLLFIPKKFAACLANYRAYMTLGAAYKHSPLCALVLISNLTQYWIDSLSRNIIPFATHVRPLIQPISHQPQDLNTQNNGPPCLWPKYMDRSMIGSGRTRGYTTDTTLGLILSKQRIDGRNTQRTRKDQYFFMNLYHFLRFYA